MNTEKYCVDMILFGFLPETFALCSIASHSKQGKKPVAQTRQLSEEIKFING